MTLRFLWCYRLGTFGIVILDTRELGFFNSLSRGCKWGGSGSGVKEMNLKKKKIRRDTSFHKDGREASDMLEKN